MPSRAVIRKNRRRESKRKTSGVEGAVVAVSMPLQGVDYNLPPEVVGGKKRSVLVACRKRSRTVVEEGEGELHPVEGLSRKERRRLETKRLFERQLERLGATAARKVSVPANGYKGVEGEGDEKDKCDGNVNAAFTPSGDRLRHDPKFKNGTFWRTRKEQRGRTVFLGNMPIRFTAQDVMDFVSSLMYAAGMVQEKEGSPTAVVDSVDFLPVKPQAKRRHMYVTLRSKEVAAHIAKTLDSYLLDGVGLRCNFASDKTQRSEAIQRRSGGTSVHGH